MHVATHVACISLIAPNKLPLPLPLDLFFMQILPFEAKNYKASKLQGDLYFLKAL